MNEWSGRDFVEYCLFGKYINAFSTKHEKVTSFAWFINQYKTHFKTYYNNTITTGWQEKHNSSVFEWEWYLRPRKLKVLVFFITFYISVYACFLFSVFDLTEAQNLLLIRRMSFRSVIKTKKEYGHRGKESIHSFRKTMHVRDHQPLQQQYRISIRWTFFELTTINFEHKRQLMDKEVKCLPIKHNNRFHYLK